MKRTILSLAAVSVLGITADRADAEGALAIPMGAHVAAKHGIPHAGYPHLAVTEVGHKRHGHHGYYRGRRGDHRGRHGHHGGHWGHHRGPVIAQPHWGHPAVIVPAPVYRYRGYPYGPRHSFRYRGHGLSFGFAF